MAGARVSVFKSEWEGEKFDNESVYSCLSTVCSSCISVCNWNNDTFPLLWSSLVTLIQAELIKLVFEPRDFFFFFNAAIHSGAIKHNAGDTFISKFLQLRLTQWGFYWAGPFQSCYIKVRALEN